MLIDFHTHTILSDGVLTISELVRRAEVNGYKAISITDHVDFSNLERIIKEAKEACFKINKISKIKAIPGVEITHVHPNLIPEIVQEAKKLGAILIIVHGETISEPVYPGTNKIGILSGIDILAHPGLITDEDLELAKEKNIYLELTSRQGHCLTNGHVAKKAIEYGIPLVINSDAHLPGDLFNLSKWEKIALGAGLGEEEFEKIKKNSFRLLKNLLEKLER